MASEDTTLATATFEEATEGISFSASPAYSLGTGITAVQSSAGVGENTGLPDPPMQRYTDEDLLDCPIEECLTAQWDQGVSEPGSFETTIGTHYFYTEPATFNGEPGNKPAHVKKFLSPVSETVATCEHLTIVTILDEGIGSNSAWCKIKVQDLGRSREFYNVVGYVKRSDLRRLKYGTQCWGGPSTLPSPKYVKHKRRKKPTWSLGSPWYEMLACEPWLDEKDLKYKTMVNTGHKNREVMDMLEDQAKRIGIKQLMVYYDRLPSGYDVRTLDNGVAHLNQDLYNFAKVEKTYLSDRPDDSVKALVSVNLSHLLAVPRMVRSFTTATEIRTGHRTVMYQSNTMEKKLKKVSRTMENLQASVDLFPGTIKGSQNFSPKKWGKMIGTFMPALNKLFKANGYNLRKDHEDMIEIGTDADFNPTHVIVYPDDTGLGMPQTIAFNNFASQIPASSARLMHYILQGNNMFSDAKKPDMSSLTPPWMTYLTAYTFPPLEIRPTPPSGLNVPKLADLGNIANQFNALPIKGPKDLKFENLKLKDPAFLADMAAVRFDVALPAGDNIVGNLPAVLDKINSLDDVYAELLQKISIPVLIEQAMAKLMAELGLDNIYAALLEAALGQFTIDALIKQFMLQLPDDLIGDLLQQLLDMLDVSCDDLINLMVDMGISTDHLQGIVEQIGDEIEGLQDQIDAAKALVPQLCDSTELEADTSLDEDLEDAEENIANSLENMLANLTCDDLKLIIQKIAAMGVPTFDFEPPTIDLSCFVKDLELAMGAALMPFMIPLTGMPLDITRLGEIDWSGLTPSAPNINLMTPDGFINISDWDTQAADLAELPGFGLPTGGFNPAVASPDMNYPQFALGGIDVTTGDLSLSPGGLQFPNVKLAEAFSDLEVPGGIETLIEAIGGLADGAIPGISLEDLGPEGGANLSELSDVKFGELLDDWRRVFVEAFSGFLLSNFMFSIAGGGKPFSTLTNRMRDMSWGSEGASMEVPTSDGSTIPNSTIPNIPEWDAAGVQVPEGGCTLSADVTETTGVGWQTIATMPREWWQSSVDGSSVDSVVSLPDFESLKAQILTLGTDARVAAIEILQVIEDLKDFDFSAGFNPCDLFAKCTELTDALSDIEFDPEAGEYFLAGEYAFNIADIQIPTAVFRPAVGCGTFQLYGIPDFGLGGMSLPIPIAGPNGDETFDIFDMNNLLSKLPEIPNFPDVLPDIPATDIGLDISILCDKPDLFAILTDMMVGDIPDVPAALGSFDAVIGSMEGMNNIQPGTAGGIPAKQIMIALFKFIIDKLGLSAMISELTGILMQFMDAGDLTLEMIQDIPAIQSKMDAMSIPGASMPTFSPPALGGLGGGGFGGGGGGGGGGFGGFGGGGGGGSGGGGGGGSSPSLEAPPASLPGAGMPSGSPGGGDTTGGAIASMGGKFTIPTITLPDNIPTGDLMGAMFSGMQDSVKSAIEQAIVEMGKSVLRSLLDSVSDGGFGDLDIMDALSDAFGALAAEDLACDVFSNMGVDCQGNITDKTLLTTTTVNIEMGCGEPLEIDEDDEPCPPSTFIRSVSARMSKQETALLLQGVVGPKMCVRIQDVMRDECPHYAIVFDDCQKIADTFEAIGDYIPKIIAQLEDPVIPVLKDLRKICCEDPIRRRTNDGIKAGKSPEEAVADAAAEVAQQVTDLGNLAKTLMGLPNGVFDGDGHGGTIVPDVWPECEDSCPADPEAPPKPSLFPPDNEIPTLDFMNTMATDLMYEPLRLAFKMESDLYPEMLISGTVQNTPVPFWEAAGTHEAGGDAGISRFAEQLYNGGAVLCDSNGELFNTNDVALDIVRNVLSAQENSNYGGDWDTKTFKDIHVLQQQNSGSVVPVLHKSLNDYDYVSNVWDEETQTYAWYFQYGGEAETPIGEEWPTVTWAMQPITEKQLSASATTSAALTDNTTTTVPSTYETPMGAACDEYSATTSEAVEAPSGFEFEEGLPYKYQLFRQFVREKFTKHPMLLEGVDVTSLDSWTAMGLDDDGDGFTDFGFRGIYQQVINQIIQSAGIQITFTELFSADTLKILELEPTEFSPTSCGEKPESLLDLEESGKKPTKDAFMKACKSPQKEKETGKNPLKQAGLVGLTEMTVRAYVIDHMLRAIFPLSEYDLIDFDGVFLQQVADKIHREMQLLDPQYETAFMDTLIENFKSMCEAAKCKDEPLTDPMTGEEIDDCDSIDPLMYYIKKHLVDVSKILDGKFGSSTPNLSKAAEDKWLTTLTLPEYPIPDDMDVSGMMSQADLYATLLNNPRPEVSLEGMTTYYTGETAATTDSSTSTEDTDTETDAETAEPTASTYIEMDITSVNSGEMISPFIPDNLPLPRLFTFTETNYSTADLAYVGKEAYVSDGAETETDGAETEETRELVTLGAQWQEVDDPTTAFLGNNPHNNLYYSLTKNWNRPGHAAYLTPDLWPVNSEVKGGLYLEKFIKIGDEYWNADNLQTWFELLIDAATKEEPDPMAVAALAQYALTEAHYGLRLCYMFPTNVGSEVLAQKSDLYGLLNGMFGTSYGIMPDVSKMQGSFLQPEAVIFNAEVTTEVPLPTEETATSTDSETTTDEEAESEPTMVSATAIQSHQATFFNFSIPLVEVTMSAGSPITTVLDEIAEDPRAAVDAAAEYYESGTIPTVAAYDTPWTNASAALEEKISSLRIKLRKSEDWKFIFRQCFHTNAVVQNLWNYCSMMTTASVPRLDMAFAETKSELRKLFWTLYHDIGTGSDGFSFTPESTSMEVATLNTDTDGGGLPLPIKMALNTIPMLFKGIAEAIDPNIMIAKLIRVAADGDQGKIAKFPSTLMALPFNIIPPPPFGPGIGPPITPIGLAYLALGALTPMEKQTMRMAAAAAPPPPGGDDEGTDADCNPEEDEADE